MRGGVAELRADRPFATQLPSPRLPTVRAVQVGGVTSDAVSDGAAKCEQNRTEQQPRAFLSCLIEEPRVSHCHTAACVGWLNGETDNEKEPNTNQQRPPDHNHNTRRTTSQLSQSASASQQQHIGTNTNSTVEEQLTAQLINRPTLPLDSLSDIISSSTPALYPSPLFKLTTP